MSSFLTVFSDTHGNGDLLYKLNGDFLVSNKIVFLGDGASDLNYIPTDYQDKIVAVRGNCDFSLTYPKQALFTVEKVTVLAVHGDEFGVKLGLTRLLEYAKKVKAKLVLYGHTHQPKITEIDGVTLVNPGSLSDYTREKTFAFIKIDGDKITATNLLFNKRV